MIDTLTSKIPLLSIDFRRPSSPTYKWQFTRLSQLTSTTSLQMITGRLLGGTSKVNAQLYTRGVPGEFNAWAEAGLKNWSWEVVEPYFKKSERSLHESPLSYRGTQGNISPFYEGCID